MKVRLIGSLREFDALAPAWSELLDQSGQTSPLASHEWFASCWRTAGPERRRELWMVEDCVGPVAMIPLVHSRTRVRGLPVRRLEFLGAGDAPFVDVPLARDCDAVTTAFLDALAERRDWDQLRLGRLPGDSPLFKTLTAILPDRAHWQLSEPVASPYLTIEGSWEQFQAGLPSTVRDATDRVESALARRGTLALDVHHEMDPNSAVFQDAVEVSKVSWRDQGMPRLFRELLHRASGRRWLRLWILRLDGRPIATEYQIGANGSIHALGVDSDAALANLRPGACLNALVVRALFEHGDAREYNMGTGSADRRLDWANGSHEVFSLQIFPSTVYGRLLHRMAPKQCA